MSEISLDLLDENRQLIFKKLTVFRRFGYLAGGTALALQLHHRRSFDFDVFVSKPIGNILRQTALKAFGKQQYLLDTADQLTFAPMPGTEVTFLYYWYKPLGQPITTSSIAIASIEDIAADKADGWLVPEDRVFALHFQGVVRAYPQKILNWHEIVNVTTTWSEWKKQYPETQILSRNTGYVRNYDQYPYGTYEKDDELLFGVEGLDKSLQIKTVVYGIEFNGMSKAYPESLFDRNNSIEDKIADTSIKLERKSSGEIEVINLQTNQKIIPVRLFWFAWAAFHPDTEIYKSK